MSVTTKKVFGIVLIFLAVVGLLLSAFLIAQIWRYRQPVVNGLQNGLDHTSALLQTTDDGLNVIDEVVTNVYSSTLYLDDATKALGQTMQSTTNFIDSAGTFVGQDLITTITNTQTALSSAQSSAAVIDNILTSISSVPFLGLSYNPGTPLNKALGNVSSSLDPVQKSLKSFQTDLTTAQSNMQALSDQITSLNQKVTTINKNLAQARLTIANYRMQVNALKVSVANAKANMYTWVTTIAWVLTFIILVMVVLQAAILLQGVMLLLPEHAHAELPEKTQE